MRIKIQKSCDPQDWEKVNPNFIYNRFDLFCKPDEFETIKICNGNETKVLEYRITGDQAELGLWLMPIDTAELERVICFLVKNHPNVQTITYKNGVLPYGKAKAHNHFRIVFPETVDEMLGRISSKSRAKQRKKLKAAEEAYGKMTFSEYDRSNIPTDIVETFFKFKFETRDRRYGMTAEAYLDRYHVSNCYVIRFGDTVGAIRFSCEQCPIVYGENFTYNPELKDYSLGRAVFIYHLIRMVEKKHTEMFFAGGDYEYKRHYGSIEQMLYDCEIRVSELDFAKLSAQDSLLGTMHAVSQNASGGVRAAERQNGNEDSMKKPAISIILTAGASESLLSQTAESLRTQTFQDFEVLLTGSAEESNRSREGFENQDARFTLAAPEIADRGLAKNQGVSAAGGAYILFLKSGDCLRETMLEELYRKATETHSDIVVCDSQNDVQGKRILCKAVNRSWVREEIFSYRDCPDSIMCVMDSCTGNKLFRKDFLQSHALEFMEHSTFDDFAFVPVCAGSAEKIAYIPKPLIVLGADGEPPETKKLVDIADSVSAAAKTVRELPYSDLLENAVLSFVADSFLLSLTRYVKNFSEPDAAEFYRIAHDTFCREEFENVTTQTFHNQKRYLEFLTVRKHGYAEMKHLLSRRMIVSLTSYPRRIHGVSKALEAIYTQTHKPDQVVLWLAEEEFPGKEADLPGDLTDLVGQGKLCVRWCDNLKPHKKYFYALQEYGNDVVVTIDDDLIYPKDMLECLWNSYLLYPEAVSALRTHLILISEQNTILPYNTWPQETDTCIYQPSMQLFATSGAGTLFPPNLLDRAFFDKEAIKETCLIADDLWLKAAEVISNVPVVLARPYEHLKYLPNSQEEALYRFNMKQNQNDVQLQKIIDWTDIKFGQGALIEKLKMPYDGVSLCGIEAVSGYLDRERKSYRDRRVIAERKLQDAQDSLKDTRSQLQNTRNQLQNAQNQLRNTQNQLQNTQNQLQRAEERNRLTKAELEKAQNTLRQTQKKLTAKEKECADTRSALRRAEKAIPVKNQLAELGKMLRSRRPAGAFFPVWCLKYAVYLLSWIPETILAGMMYYLKNGLRQTVKQVGRKLSGKKKP